MLEFAHALTGAVIAYKVGNPLLSLPLALASHFALDLLPHWNFHLDEEEKGHLSKKLIFWLTLDSLLGLFLGLFVFFKSFGDWGKMITILMGSFLAILPDFIEAPYYLFGIKNRYVDKILAFQKKHQWNVSFWPGIIFQVAYTIFLLLYI